MLKLAGSMLLVTGCTAVTNFASYHVGGAEDLSAEVSDFGDAGKPSDGGDGGNVDLSVDAAPLPDLSPITCANGAACCAEVPCTAGGCCVSGSCFPSGSDTTIGSV